MPELYADVVERIRAGRDDESVWHRELREILPYVCHLGFDAKRDQYVGVPSSDFIKQIARFDEEAAARLEYMCKRAVFPTTVVDGHLRGWYVSDFTICEGMKSWLLRRKKSCPV